MIQWIQDNIQNILIAIGAAVVLFWPKIQEQLKALQAGGGEAPKEEHKHCNCCCPEEPDHDDSDKSVWVVRTMETRAYCLDHKLDDGVKLCEELVGVLVASKPKKTIIVKEG